MSHRRGDVPRTLEANLAAAQRLLDRAAAVQPDIVCLPEHFSFANVPHERALDVAEPVPGPTTHWAAAAARRHHMYVVCPVYERTGGRVFNAAVLLDRAGEIAGVYRKVHPTVGEMGAGVVPGERVEVFETDFGRIGILICFDIAWPERWRELKALEAEIVFWPSTYEGGLPLQARASDNEYYVVAATLAWHATIFDITGFPLAGTGQRWETAWSEVDLEKRVFSAIYPSSTYDAIAARYGRRVRVEMLSPEGVFTLESLDPAVTVDDVIREFDLETLRDHYYRRSVTEQERARLAYSDGSVVPRR